MNAAVIDEEVGLGRKALNRIVGRFRALGDRRLKRIRATLTHEQQCFFDLLPLLWHVNHPTLPGFVSSETPAGVIGFRPNRDQLLLARRYVRGFKEDRQPHHDSPILGIYLMGSMGSLGQTVGSDLDFWLCHSGQIDERERAELRCKAARLEEHAAEIGLHAHFFLMHDASFRDGAVDELSKESSGTTQHTLLLEEFYRTGLLVAGNPLLWWAVPPEHEPHYSRYTQRLIHRRFIRPHQWLDFGGLHSLPADEFFGVAHWQLFKGIDAPYKSLLKLMLLEAYAAEYPKVDWLCMETKRAIYASDDTDADKLDPYLLILDRITHYLTERNEPERLQLARRAFYFKAGQALAMSAHSDDWRRKLMLRQCERWGWTEQDLALLDTRPQWKLDQVVDERNALVSELSRSYRLLTDFAREQGAMATRDTHELALLGRKLYAALDKRPGKVDRVNPGISRDLSERLLWLQRVDSSPTRWQLFQVPPEEPPHIPTKTCLSLAEILAWLHLNGICDRSTRVHYLPKPPGYGEPEQSKILQALRKHLPREQAGDGTLDAYADDARGTRSLWFINVAVDPLASHADAGYQLISERVDALSFGAAHECLVANVEHLYVTSWGEVRIERHTDGEEGLLDCLCRYLNLFAPHQRLQVSANVFSFSSTRGGAIAQRVAHLVRSVAQTFHRLGDKARYILRIGDRYFQIHRQKQNFTWSPIGEAGDIDTHLAENIADYCPTRIDPISMLGSPLPVLMTRNRKDVIQVFYASDEHGVQLYIFDECGAVFQQRIDGADDRYIMIQQRRFLDTVATQRLVSPATATHEPALNFARVSPQRDGDWQISPVTVPVTRITDHMEMVLVVSTGGSLQDGFSLRFGNREFDSLLLGEALYREAADFLAQRRRGKGSYPVYLTGVVGFDGQPGTPCRLMDLLRLKHQVERRLNEAMNT